MRAGRSLCDFRKPHCKERILTRRPAVKHHLSLIVLLATMAVSIGSCGVGPRGCCCADGPDWAAGERVKGSGDVIRVDRSVGGFDEVHLATIGTLHIEMGDREELVIEGEANIIEHIEVEVRGGTLKIANERNYNLRPTEPLDYYLTVRDLKGIALSSAGDAFAPDITSPHFSIRVSSSGSLETGSIETRHLDVSVSSSGDVSIPDLESDNLDVSLSSSGELAIHGGRVDAQDVRVSSSGTYGARDLESRRAQVRLSSSGNAYIRVSEDLDARLSSSGSVYYMGNPRVRQQTSSSGRLRRLDV
jgi:hypothetical protein